MIARGAPFYFDWRADAAALLVHHGPSGQTEQPSGHAVGLLDIESGQRKTVSHSPASFGAPSWSFDSQWMAYGDGRQRPVSLMIAPADGSSPKPFARVSQRIAIGWSPTQTLVAVATTSLPGGAVFEELRLIDIASGQIRRLVTEPFVAYFWSPDGKRIVYARRRPGSRLGTWVVVSVASGQTSEVIDFAPSRTLSQVFPLLRSVRPVTSALVTRQPAVRFCRQRRLRRPPSARSPPSPGVCGGSKSTGHPPGCGRRPHRLLVPTLNTGAPARCVPKKSAMPIICPEESWLGEKMRQFPCRIVSSSLAPTLLR